MYHQFLRVMPLIFFIGLALTTVLTLMPAPDIPSVFSFWDKAEHALSFVMLTFTGSLAFKNKTKIIWAGLVFYGALIEVMQSTLTTTRTGDASDWLADCIGILLGIGLYWLLQKWMPIETL